MNTYRSFDRNNCMYFMIKEETFLISIIKFGKHFIKTRRFNSELLCNKKYKR